MAKLSQIEKVLASLKADREVLNMAIAKIEAQMEHKAKPTAVRKVRKLGSVLDEPA